MRFVKGNEDAVGSVTLDVVTEAATVVLVLE